MVINRPNSSRWDMMPSQTNKAKTSNSQNNPEIEKMVIHRPNSLRLDIIPTQTSKTKTSNSQMHSEIEKIIINRPNRQTQQRQAISKIILKLKKWS